MLLSTKYKLTIKFIPFILCILCCSFCFSQTKLLIALEGNLSEDILPKELTVDLKEMNFYNFNTLKATNLAHNNPFTYSNIKIMDSSNYSFYELDHSTNKRSSLNYGMKENLTMDFRGNKMQESINWNVSYPILDYQNGKTPISLTNHLDVAMLIVTESLKDNDSNRSFYLRKYKIGNFSFNCKKTFLKLFGTMCIATVNIIE